MALCCTSPTATRRRRPWSAPASPETCCRGGTSLHEGPVPDLPPDELRRVRAEYLATLGREPAGRGTASRARRAPARRDREPRAGRPVVRARPLRPAPADPDPRRAARLGPSMRRADLHRRRSPAGRASPASASSSQRSSRACGRCAPRSRPSTSTSPARRGTSCAASDPRALARAAATPDERLPYLAPALRRLLEELPGTRDGLGRTERQLLEAVAAGARTRVDAFLASMAAEEAPFMGDTIAFDRLAELDGLVTATAACSSPRTAGPCWRATRTASLCSASIAGSAACTSAPKARCGAGTTSEAS